MSMQKWYIGVMNDASFIINTPPRPSTDDVWHNRPDGPTMVLPVHGLQDNRADRIVDAHNEEADIARNQMEQLRSSLAFANAWLIGSDVHRRREVMGHLEESGKLLAQKEPTNA